MIANVDMASPEGGGAASGLFLMASFILIFYFLLIRPQRKQQKAHDEMVKKLKRGDEVATVGGIVGKVVHLTDERVTVKSGDTRIEVERSKVGRVLSASE
ncbi:MAG: preprotein translocase subunit YajC [Gemmatimonadota bacterium]